MREAHNLPRGRPRTADKNTQQRSTSPATNSNSTMAANMTCPTLIAPVFKLYALPVCAPSLSGHPRGAQVGPLSRGCALPRWGSAARIPERRTEERQAFSFCFGSRPCLGCRVCASQTIGARFLLSLVMGNSVT